MCKCCLEVLSKSGNGVIHRVSNEKYRVEYGNMLISFDENQFNVFKRFILNMTEDKAKSYLLPPSNKIVIQPSNYLGSYTFNLNEFVDLQMLFKNAADNLRIEEELKTIFK